MLGGYQIIDLKTSVGHSDAEVEITNEEDIKAIKNYVESMEEDQSSIKPVLLRYYSDDDDSERCGFANVKFLTASNPKQWIISTSNYEVDYLTLFVSIGEDNEYTIVYVTGIF